MEAVFGLYCMYIHVWHMVCERQTDQKTQTSFSTLKKWSDCATNPNLPSSACPPNPPGSPACSRASVLNSSTLNHELWISSMKQRESEWPLSCQSGWKAANKRGLLCSHSCGPPAAPSQELKGGKAALGAGGRGMREYQLKPQFSQYENKEVLSPRQNQPTEAKPTELTTAFPQVLTQAR